MLINTRQAIWIRPSQKAWCCQYVLPLYITLRHHKKLKFSKEVNVTQRVTQSLLSENTACHPEKQTQTTNYNCIWECMLIVLTSVTALVMQHTDWL